MTSGGENEWQSRWDPNESAWSVVTCRQPTTGVCCYVLHFIHLYINIYRYIYIDMPKKKRWWHFRGRDLYLAATRDNTTLHTWSYTRIALASPFVLLSVSSTHSLHNTVILYSLLGYYTALVHLLHSNSTYILTLLPKTRQPRESLYDDLMSLVLSSLFDLLLLFSLLLLFLLLMLLLLRHCFYRVLVWAPNHLYQEILLLAHEWGHLLFIRGLLFILNGLVVIEVFISCEV